MFLPSYVRYHLSKESCHNYQRSWQVCKADIEDILRLVVIIKEEHELDMEENGTLDHRRNFRNEVMERLR